MSSMEVRGDSRHSLNESRPQTLSQPRHHFLLPPKHDRHGQITLVLDLDGTLIHGSRVPLQNPDFIIKIRQKEANFFTFYVQIRPFLKQFLQALSPCFELILFTASHEKYSQLIVSLIEYSILHSPDTTTPLDAVSSSQEAGSTSAKMWHHPTATLGTTGRTSQTIKHILSREHCLIEVNRNEVDTEGQPMVYIIKDLSRLGRSPGRICLLDNSIHSGRYQPQLSVVCSTWKGDPTDHELSDLIPFFLQMSRAEERVDQFLRRQRTWIHPLWQPPVLMPPALKTQSSDTAEASKEFHKIPSFLFNQPVTFPFITSTAVEQFCSTGIANHGHINLFDRGTELAMSESQFYSQYSPAQLSLRLSHIRISKTCTFVPIVRNASPPQSLQSLHSVPASPGDHLEH
ncbi:putative Carboxy-terminal domain RNA polymerase II polypeptide A small phosphatase 1 [Blattamonas nauphoetae]|uniref:Mitochondrial import inner membrane translocase subunit TIM50 n=1 Tax=Blattamonas nauphoetae TaxID=2049346 RepID=A0ABQ9YIP2_9EUKA|nr:putative Carboxy-terminal domain RNA polymerase II polypeptide A small phosphatase 1 [Blattamonas nauphoetae]